jgi:hypothetical protein
VTNNTTTIAARRSQRNVMFCSDSGRYRYAGRNTLPRISMILRNPQIVTHSGASNSAPERKALRNVISRAAAGEASDIGGKVAQSGREAKFFPTVEGRVAAYSGTS